MPSWPLLFISTVRASPSRFKISWNHASVIDANRSLFIPASTRLACSSTSTCFAAYELPACVLAGTLPSSATLAAAAVSSAPDAAAPRRRRLPRRRRPRRRLSVRRFFSSGGMGRSRQSRKRTGVPACSESSGTSRPEKETTSSGVPPYWDVFRESEGSVEERWRRSSLTNRLKGR